MGGLIFTLLLSIKFITDEIRSSGLDWDEITKGKYGTF
jgi:hypothetical protein